MLEFKGNFACVRAKNFYTDEQIQWINEEAEKYHLKV
jgi:hypothetical protein